MLNQIPFKVERTTIMGRVDSALLTPIEEDDLCESFVLAVIGSLSTEIEVEAGGVSMHLAAWRHPDHWSTDWAEKGIDDPEAFIASLVRPYVPPRRTVAS